MRLIGFNFTKVYAERLKDKTESIKFNTKMNILSVESIKSDILKTKEEIVKVNFSFILLYEPGFAKIEIAGNALVSLDSKIAKEVLKGFNEKSVPEEFRIFILNIILKKSSIKALQLEEEFGLPIHLPLFSINKDSLKEKK
jgi:hypothetical protein